MVTLDSRSGCVRTTNEIAVIIKCPVTYSACTHKSVMALEAVEEGKIMKAYKEGYF